MADVLSKLSDLFLLDPVPTISNIALQLLLIRAHCHVLDIRAKKTFATLMLLALLYAFLERIYNPNYGTHISPFGPITLFVLPIVFSRGRLRMRTTKSFLIAFALLASEGLGLAVCVLLGMEIPVTVVPGTGMLDQSFVLVAYTGGLIFATILLEMLMALFDDVMDATLTGPALTLLIISYPLISAVFMRAHVLSMMPSMLFAAAVLTTILTMFLCIALVYLTRKDVLATRQSADRMARARQARHIRIEVEGIARRSDDIRRLRHDLANQVDVVAELTRQGRVREADGYLEALIDQTRRIAGGAHE